MLKQNFMTPVGGLAVALLLGLLAQNAIAAKPAVADAGDPVATTQAVRAEFQDKMAKYLEALDEQVDLRLHGKLQQLQLQPAKPIYVASVDTRIRV